MAILTAGGQSRIFAGEIKGVIANLSAAAQKEDIEKLEQLAQKIKRKMDDFYQEDRKLNIGIIGQVKAGKSSLFKYTFIWRGRAAAKSLDTENSRIDEAGICAAECGGGGILFKSGVGDYQAECAG